MTQSYQLILYYFKMGLQAAMVNAIANPKRTVRVLWRQFCLITHVILSWIIFKMPSIFPFTLLQKFFTNTNIREEHSRIPQPKYYNSSDDIQAIHQILSLLWVNDLASHLNNDKTFNQSYNEYDYDTIVKLYFPTKNSAMESVNIHRTWENSYWNPQHTYEDESVKLEAYRKSDILFADMMTNTQGIYKVKKVFHGTEIKKKVEIFFEDLLEANRDIFCEAELGTNVIDSLINNQNLFYLDYPEIRKTQSKRITSRYYNRMTTIQGNSVNAYIEIPFAIFANVKDFARKDETDFLCLASVFNDTYKKKSKEDVNQNQIFHGLSSNLIQRDRWQMAKCHIAATDTNDFTFRVHLGWLHYASSIYTAAFVNLSRNNRNLNWLKTQFIDIFSNGLLQIDFMANLTLIDHQQPMAEKIFYMTRQKTVEMIREANGKFNIMQFDPQHLGENSFESDAVKMSKAYYRKIQTYIDYLFEIHEESWKNSTKKMGEILFKELGDQHGRFDGIPDTITRDQTPQSLKKVMTNLAYLWIVHHGETFSLVSVSNSFFLVPPMLRKPLKSLQNHSKVLNDNEKQDFLPHPDIIKDSMTLHKVVTYRADNNSIISRWNDLKIKNKRWRKFLQSRNQDIVDVLDFWNDVSLDHSALNYERTKRGLFNLHWLLPNQLPISLNI